MKVRKKTILKRLSASRHNKLVAIIAILLIAGIGSYLVFSSRALEYESYLSPGYITWGDNGRQNSSYIAPPNSTIDGHIDLDTYPSPSNKPHTAPQSSVYLLFAYDPTYLRFTGSTCVWKYGCTIKTGDDLLYTAIENTPVFPREHNSNNREIWKAQALICFNIPANADFGKTFAATYQFKRTSNPLPKWTSEQIGGAPLNSTVFNFRQGLTGERQSKCESNPDFKDIWFGGGHHSCGALNDNRTGVPKCNGLSDPGIGSANLTGFGNGGNGNGGEGSGNNGTSTGSGPGPGGGAGGGGSSANRQADKPNSLPSPSPQGENKQTELGPDPFFDGKDYERGSDTDNLVFGNSTIGGKKVPKLFLYILSALLLGGAGGALYWRWKKR